MIENNITAKIKTIIMLVVVPACFLLDQLTKWLVFKKEETFMEWLVMFTPAVQEYMSNNVFSFFNIVKVWNFGISFGLFSQDNSYGYLVLIGLALLICTVFTIWMYRTNVTLIIIAIPVLVGGALGNIWDRARFQAVADFLDFHAFGWHYPAFNLADSFVFIAIGLIIFDGVFLEKKRDSISKEKKEEC